MRPTGYSPYRERESNKKIFSFKLPKLSGKFKKWAGIIGGAIFTLLLIAYLMLGDLRFFANHFLGLTFFHKNYLILLQNNYEARPGGGFITGYGEMSETMGFSSGISFHNSYEIDTPAYVTPPYPHEELLKNEWYAGYTFRDANWDPDFPTSAKTLVDFYEKKFPDKEVDGIFVVNFSMIENLVDRLGGIEVNGQKLTKENLFKALTDTVNDIDRHDEKALAQRKDILGQLAVSLMPKVKWHPFISKSVILDALASKDLYLWLKDEGLEKKVEERGWGNNLSLPETSDFLAVNLANLGSKKADRYLINQVYHQVSIKSEVPEIKTEVDLRYPGSKNIYADDYKGYLRIYIPASAEVTSDLIDAKTETIGDFKVIGTKIILPAGGRASFSYTYKLPRTLLKKDTYQLRLVKQSGENKDYIVSVESNEDSQMTSRDFKVTENKALWEGKLMSDADLSLTLLPDKSAPYPVEQVFENLKTVKIYWNEPIESSSGSDALNYSIVDMNETNPTTKDTVKVVYAEVDGNVSRLELEGVTAQDLERYKITLKDIRDTSENTISPNPKVITVVQRINSSVKTNVLPTPTVTPNSSVPPNPSVIPGKAQ